MEIDQEILIEATAQIVIAMIENNELGSGKLAETIGSVGNALINLGEPEQAMEIYEPAVNPKRSIKGDVIISLIDGNPYKMLKRHLTNHGLTPEEYRARYNLPADYPMVAPAYSETRSKLAKKIGLGRKASNLNGTA